MHVHRLVSLFRWVKTIATWRTVIESVQFLEMDNFRVAYTRFLAFIVTIVLDIRDGETLAKWLGRASSTTHPWTKPEWWPKHLTQFSS